jgi:hypothetical protein
MVPMTEGHVRGNDAFLRRISLTASMRDRVGFLDATAADGNSLRRIQDHMDDLDVRIAMREFEEAVQGIEKGRPQPITPPIPKPQPPPHPAQTIPSPHQASPIFISLSLCTVAMNLHVQVANYSQQWTHPLNPTPSSHYIYPTAPNN